MAKQSRLYAATKKKLRIILRKYNIFFNFNFPLILILGYYLYAEASNPASPGDKSRLLSKPFPATQGRCLTFWYHMYGSGIGQLNVILEKIKGGVPQTVWSKSGQQGNEWKRAQVTLESDSKYKASHNTLQGTYMRLLGDIDFIFSCQAQFLTCSVVSRVFGSLTRVFGSLTRVFGSLTRVFGSLTRDLFSCHFPYLLTTVLSSLSFCLPFLYPIDCI